MADVLASTDKKDILKLRIAPLKGKGVRKDDRPRAILHTDNIEIDSLLENDAVYNRMSEDCANRLGCKIEFISENWVSHDCDRKILSKTYIEVKTVGHKEYSRKTFWILEDMDQDIILGLNTIWYLEMQNFFTPPLRCDYYELEDSYDSDGDIIDDGLDYWDEYTYENNGYCESEDEIENENAEDVGVVNG